MKTCRRYLNVKRFFQRDEGWTFVEAVFSMMLMTVVFLGFTITLLAFREWMERAWAIRILDQYANDAIRHIEDQLHLGKFVMINPQQYGRGAFTFGIDSLNFANAGQGGAYVLTNYHTYTCRPYEGIFENINGTSTQNLYPPSDHTWPPESWRDSHEFDFTLFGIDTLNSQLPTHFNQAMVTVYFKIRYKRPRSVEIFEGVENREYVLEKEYRVSAFLKNNYSSL